jgi:hypothetical protein
MAEKNAVKVILGRIDQPTDEVFYRGAMLAPKNSKMKKKLSQFATFKFNLCQNNNQWK